MERIPINEVIKSAEAYAAERIPLSRVELVEALDPLVRDVRADRSLLRYVFFSMIAYAVYHLKGEGVVTIITENSGDGAVDVKVSTTGGELHEVGDPQSAAQEMLADPYRTGTGLPLPVVRDIIVGQGGKMFWDADGDGELRFTVSFPGISETRAHLTQ